MASFETTENNYTLQLEEPRPSSTKNVDEAGEAAVLDWRVYTLSNAGRTPSTETRTLTLTTRAEVVVETLIAPEKDAVLNLKGASADVDFSWSKPVWLRRREADLLHAGHRPGRQGFRRTAAEHRREPHVRDRSRHPGHRNPGAGSPNSTTIRRSLPPRTPITCSGPSMPGSTRT